MMEQHDASLKSDLVDLSGVDFDQLDTLPSSVLTRSLHRVLRENASNIDHYAAFQNTI
ncbi:FxSxx-COOH cyclophane-containing RiPP peptide [Lentzea sp. NPDC102401]|uniref:FxSxx-COOH cyclophane-containing RiPP peptide n=1 Tax=Lentzea sp. NPDC102401 TaxID=3364128 RepID=UPI003810101F